MIPPNYLLIYPSLLFTFSYFPYIFSSAALMGHYIFSHISMVSFSFFLFGELWFSIALESVIYSLGSAYNYYFLGFLALE